MRRRSIRARLTVALIGVVGCVLVAIAIALYVAERDAAWQQHAARSAAGVRCGIGLSLARSLAGCLGMTLTATASADGTMRFRLARARNGGVA